jgi:hypothetical protein
MGVSCKGTRGQSQDWENPDGGSWALAHPYLYSVHKEWKGADDAVVVS